MRSSPATSSRVSLSLFLPPTVHAVWIKDRKIKRRRARLAPLCRKTMCVSVCVYAQRGGGGVGRRRRRSNRAISIASARQPELLKMHIRAPGIRIWAGRFTAPRVHTRERIAAQLSHATESIATRLERLHAHRAVRFCIILGARVR